MYYTPLRLEVEAERTESGQQWLRELPTKIEKVVKQYQLEDIEVCTPGGFCSWTAHVTYKNRPAVLKLSNYDAGVETALLKSSHGQFLPILYKHQPGVILMERLSGDTIDHLIDTDYLQQLPQLLQALEDLPLLLPEKISSRLTIPEHSEEVVEIALAVIKATEEDALEVLLHGDLHPENIFLTESGLRAIDPQPLLGFREYDLEPLFRRWADLWQLSVAETALDELSAHEIDPLLTRSCALQLGLHYLNLSDDPERQQLWRRRLEFWLQLDLSGQAVKI